jgi:hypothetical protein
MDTVKMKISLKKQAIYRISMSPAEHLIITT